MNLKKYLKRSSLFALGVLLAGGAYVLSYLAIFSAPILITVIGISLILVSAILTLLGK